MKEVEIIKEWVLKAEIAHHPRPFFQASSFRSFFLVLFVLFTMRGMNIARVVILGEHRSLPAVICPLNPLNHTSSYDLFLCVHSSSGERRLSRAHLHYSSRR